MLENWTRAPMAAIMIRIGKNQVAWSSVKNEISAVVREYEPASAVIIMIAGLMIAVEQAARIAPMIAEIAIV